MRTLDDRITFTFSGVTGHTEGMYQYQVKRYLTQVTSELIFAGNFYYNGSDSSITFDVTDIIASDGFVVKEDLFNSAQTIKNNVANKYFINVIWSESDIVVNSDWVAKVYKYRNKDLGFYVFYTFFEPDTFVNASSLETQGNIVKNGIPSLVLLPHYPMKNEYQAQEEFNHCPFGFSFLVGNDVSGITLSFEVDDSATEMNITAPSNSFSVLGNCQNYALFDDLQFVPYNDGKMYWVKNSGGTKQEVAIFDVCPKKYYLFWQDRYGSFQCQGFNNYANYSETFDRSEVKDYQNRSRNSNVKVQSKWKLNSGWIAEDLYPYYESIYTSPILILYDNERDIKYSVMVSGDYEEKTYRNQKKMINMNLELSENKKQNIIY